MAQKQQCLTPLIQEMQLLGESNGLPESKKSHVKNSRFSRLSRFSVKDLTSALKYIEETWKSGISQAIINMPLVLAIGYSSGCNGSVGLTTGFIAAFVNGFLSGSNHSIYMPSFTVMSLNLSLSQIYGVEIIPWITLISGLLIYLMSLMKWHQLSDYLPEFVTESFYLGVGFYFIVGYSDYAFGIMDQHTIRGFRQYPNLFSMYYHYAQRGSWIYLSKSISIFLFLQISRIISKPFPSVLITTCFGLFMGVLYPTDINLHSVFGDSTVRFHLLEMPNITFDFNTLFDLIMASFPIAISVTMQNLLCARGAQTLTGVKCDYDQETLCVAVANILSGILGGIPCCASSRMYTLDIRMRDINKWSSILNAGSIYIFYGLFSQYFLQIPLYVVSGQLFFLLYQFPPWSYLYKLYRTQRKLTLLKCLFVGWICYNYGAIYSTIIGSMHSLFLFAQKMSAAASEIIVNTDQDQSSQIRQSFFKENDKLAEDDLPDPTLKGTYTLYRFTGSVNYINIKNHINQIKQLADTDYIVFSFRYVSVFDEQAIDKLAQLIENMMSILIIKLETGHEIIMTGLHKGMIEEMKHNDFFKEFFELCVDKYKTLGA